jgi:hemoglobin
MSTPSLYERLGRKDGISRIVRDVITNHLANPLIKARFAGVKDMDRLHKVSTEFICMGAGGPETYTGRDMIATHKGMNVSEQEFIEVVDDITAALDKNSIDAQTKSDVIGVLFSLKAQVVRL